MPLPASADNLREELRVVPAEESRELRKLGGTHGIFGWQKDFERLSEPADFTKRLVREDEAIIHFTLVVKEIAGPLELIAYDFELYYPSKQPIWFIRFDMNEPGHQNDALGLRSHVHPGHEDLLIPGVMLSPVEALSFLLFGFRLRLIGSSFFTGETHALEPGSRGRSLCHRDDRLPL